MAHEKAIKKQNVLNGAMVLVVATALVKIIGAVYKIPLMSLLTPEGNGYFQGAYAIYNPLYAISMAGLPIAVALGAHSLITQFLPSLCNPKYK